MKPRLMLLVDVRVFVCMKGIVGDDELAESRATEQQDWWALNKCMMNFVCKQEETSTTKEVENTVQRS